MKASVNSDSLKKALAIALKAVPSRPTHPILGNVFIQAREGQLTLTGFDLSLGIRVSIDATVEEEEDLAVPAKLFLDIVSKLEGFISLSTDGENLLSINSLQGSYEVRAMGADEYPELPSPEADGSYEVKISSDDLADGIKNTLFSSSTDETKQILTAVCISSGDTGKAPDGVIGFGATDGHRLATAEIPGDAITTTKDGGFFSICVPRATCTEILKLSGDVTIRVNSAIAEFSAGDMKIVSRLLDGSYPAYSQLIPNTFETRASIDRQSLLNALERVGVIAERKNNVVKMVFKDQELTISVDAADVGSGKEILSTQITGKDITIAFNVKYLLESLRNLQSHEVTLQMNTPTSPLIVSPLGGIKVTHLIMPVQLRD